MNPSASSTAVFELTIRRVPGPAADGRATYTVSARSDEHGEATAGAGEELADLVRELSGPRWRDARRREPEATAPEPREVGRRLFLGALPGPVRHLWSRAKGSAGSRDRSLRLSLRLGDAPELAVLPWELLFDPDENEPLAIDWRTPFARYLELPRPLARLAVEGRLRVAVFAPEPADQHPLDADGEIARLREALGPDVELQRIEGGRLRDLRRGLADFDPHVLHWIGHGHRGESGVELLLEGRGGRSEPLDAARLGALLPHGGPRLVVLNTCESGAAETDAAFAALAPALLHAGIPAVITLRAPIRDEDAVRFSTALYSSLAAGDAVDVAVAKARHELYVGDAEDHDAWTLPVLHLRARSPHLSGPRPPSPPRGLNRLLLPGAALLVLLAALVWWLGAGPDSGSDASDAASNRGQPAERTTAEESAAGESPPSPDASPTSRVVNDPRCPSVPGLDLPMIYVEPGAFDMGSTVGESDEEPVHRVRLRDPFCLGVFEVTVGQWNAVLPDSAKEPEGVEHPEQLPVTHVSWEEAGHFLGELNRRVEGRPYRLPTEAEWEYAARAGTTTEWSFGDDPADLPHYGNCSVHGSDPYDRTAPVGSYQPNPWGFYDLHGNVTEWVADTYGPYPDGPVTDPRGAGGPEDGEELKKVRRGGNFATKEENCRSARRFASAPDHNIHTTGFRAAADPLGRGRE